MQGTSDSNDSTRVVDVDVFIDKICFDVIILHNSISRWISPTLISLLNHIHLAILIMSWQGGQVEVRCIQV